MKLYVLFKFGSSFYIVINTYMVSDWDVCSYLDLPLEEYRNILRSHGARQKAVYNDMYFTNRSQAEAALIALEPYLIMANLTK